MSSKRFAFVVVSAGLIVGLAQAAYVQVGLPLDQLPQEHDYQKTLRTYMATLTEADFAVEHKPIAVAPITDPEQLYRLWLLPLNPPRLGAAALPPAAFTLGALESQHGIRMPTTPNESQMMAWLAGWDYPGNPYRAMRAVKLRGFVLAAVDLMMLDYLYEHDPRGANRSDYLGGNLIWIGFTYRGVKDILPPEVRAAFEAGLKKHVLRLQKWGPTGLMTDMDLFASVGLRYVYEASADPEVRKIAEDYARLLYTDERYFHPAGYFVDNHCFDTSYNGISLYFATFAALASDWDFIRTAVDKAFRLRARLCFPDPAGGFSGPSHMSARCSSDPPRDQWQFPHRPYGSAMVTDESLYLAPLPTTQAMVIAHGRLITDINSQLSAARRVGTNSWCESHWSGFINFAHDYYKPGYYARRLKLEAEHSPLLKPVYQREGNFVETFERALTIVRFDTYAAAVHTGPVGAMDRRWGRPHGMGGGQLSAFWTPGTGPALLGRRRGIQGRTFDIVDEWRIWPVHAVSGLTASNEWLSSTRIRQPQLRARCSAKAADIEVSEAIPSYAPSNGLVQASSLRYDRRFKLTAEGVQVETAVRCTNGSLRMSELYETIPVFLRETPAQKASVISFKIGNSWTNATPEPCADVSEVRVERYTNAVVVTFAKPVRARLSPAVWQDGYQTQAECRAVLIDLLDPTERPADFKAAVVSYRITAEPGQP